MPFPFWFIVTYLVFFYLGKLVFQVRFLVEDTFVHCKGNINSEKFIYIHYSRFPADSFSGGICNNCFLFIFAFAFIFV